MTTRIMSALKRRVNEVSKMICYRSRYYYYYYYWWVCVIVNLWSVITNQLYQYIMLRIRFARQTGYDLSDGESVPSPMTVSPSSIIINVRWFDPCSILWCRHETNVTSRVIMEYGVNFMNPFEKHALSLYDRP